VKLPNAANAIVEHNKIADYLLNPAHPDNGGKAVFFEELGFRGPQPEILAEALRRLAREAEVTQAQTSPHGQKYILSDKFIELFPGKIYNRHTFTFQMPDHLPTWIQMKTDIDGFRLNQIVRHRKN
jgi:hypothetical protein